MFDPKITEWPDLSKGQNLLLAEAALELLEVYKAARNYLVKKNRDIRYIRDAGLSVDAFESVMIRRIEELEERHCG